MTSVSVIGSAIFLIIMYHISCAIYNIFLHPLATFPGPRSWAASRLPYIRSLLTGTIVHDVEMLHRIYGPVVRTAPNELSFAHPQAWNDIFVPRPGHQDFLKDPLWWTKQPGQPDSLINAIDPEIHARFRRLLSPGFTTRALRAQETMIQKYVGLLIERIHEQAKTSAVESSVDIGERFMFTTFDIFGDIGFAESFDCLQHSRYHPWISLLFNSVKAASFIVAARYYPLLESMLMNWIPESLKKKQREHFKQIVDKVERRLNWEVERPDLMSHVIPHIDEKDGLTLGEVQATFMVLTTAGSETTATVLSGTLNYLLAHVEFMETLTTEVRHKFKKESDITLESLSSLPYLNAVISEGLRLCPPIPIILPRIVPAGGDTVCGLWVPGSTSVSINAWSLFRDPEFFRDPTAFRPERWLPEGSGPHSPFCNDRRDDVMVFSVGPRSCMGKNLAWAEMRLILTRLLWAFDVEAAGERFKWEELRTYLLVEKRPIMVKLKARV